MVSAVSLGKRVSMVCRSLISKGFKPDVSYVKGGRGCVIGWGKRNEYLFDKLGRLVGYTAEGSRGVRSGSITYAKGVTRHTYRLPGIGTTNRVILESYPSGGYIKHFTLDA